MCEKKSKSMMTNRKLLRWKEKHPRILYQCNMNKKQHNMNTSVLFGMKLAKHSLRGIL